MCRVKRLLNFLVHFCAGTLATRCVGNICRYDSIMASHGFKVDHTYLAYDAVESLTALTVCLALWSMKLLMKA